MNELLFCKNNYNLHFSVLRVKKSS